ncbi:MAG: glycosyltransferase family 4 protein [Planctomycetota bacterium]
MARPQPSKQTALFISQVYIPDPTSVGQHMQDAAAELVKRGWRVKVYTSARGYDDPGQRYPSKEICDGVQIVRLPLSSFGKGSIKVRLAAQLLFLFQAMLRGVFTGGLSHIIVSTSPPMAGFAALFIRLFRRVPMTFWAMDINPDQAIAMGKARPESKLARVFESMNRRLLKQSASVVALDRYMAEQLEKKTRVGDRMHVMPPWPLGDVLESLPHERNPFRDEHGLADKFVVMYSGNISPAHPIDTVLQAAEKVADEPRIVFMFIGGKAAREAIERFASERGLSNIQTLPYQPMDKIKYSLSAGDVHLVAMGDNMVGIVHPCKVYGAMAVKRPVLLVGPKQCHVGEIIDAHGIGWAVPHGEVEAMVQTVRDMAGMSASDLHAMGERAYQAMEQTYNKAALCGAFCDVVEGKPANWPPGETTR